MTPQETPRPEASGTPARSRRPLPRMLLGFLLLALAAARVSASTIYIDAGRGPVAVSVPSWYQPGVPMPLVVLLHGYGASGATQEAYMRFAPLSEELGFLYAHPDGTMNPVGQRFWNATDACCDFYDSGVDDSGYLLSLIQAIGQQLTVDADRVFLVGHSNGGFMAYRMACDHPETIAAVASLAGATWYNPEDCAPSTTVHVLQIHGTADATILYGGGQIMGVTYPGAVQTTEEWAAFDGCGLVPDTSAPPLDLDASIPGAETTVSRYAQGCTPGGSAELWTIQGAGHVPNLSAEFSRDVIGFLFLHPQDGSSGVGSSRSAMRARIAAAPNPFSAATALSFQISSDATISLDVLDAAGRHVRRLIDRELLSAGPHALRWDGRNEAGERVAGGVYLLRLSGGAGQRVGKLILME